MSKNWPKENEMGLGWTAKFPRPTEEGGHHPAVLESRQAAWDSAETVRVKHAKRTDEVRAEREAKEQEARDRRQAEDDAKRAASRAELEETLRKRFIAVGGRPDELEQEKAEIVAEHRRREIAKGDQAEEAKRRAQSSIYAGF